MCENNEKMLKLESNDISHRNLLKYKMSNILCFQIVELQKISY